MITQEEIDGWDDYKQYGPVIDYMHSEFDSYVQGRDKTPMQMVQEFSETMEQKISPRAAVDLIIEERKEWESTDICGGVEELKELADLVYVIYGYANTCGYNLDEALRRVHKNNMERCIQPDGSVKYREDGKVLKNPDAPKVDLSDLV